MAPAPRSVSHTLRAPQLSSDDSSAPVYLSIPNRSKSEPRSRSHVAPCVTAPARDQVVPANENESAAVRPAPRQSPRKTRARYDANRETLHDLPWQSQPMNPPPAASSRTP